MTPSGRPAHPVRPPARAALLIFVLTAPLLCLTALLLAEVVSRQQQMSFESQALEEARSILATLPDDVDGSDADALGQALRRPQHLEVVLIDADGVVSRSSSSVDLSDVPADVRATQTVPVSARTSVDGEPFLVAGGPTGSSPTAMFLFFSERPLRDDQGRLTLVTVSAAAGLAIAAACAGWARSHRRVRNLALRTTRERAYTAHLAHELRTPVGALVTAASLIDEPRLRRYPDELREPVQMMQNQSRRLRRIVENLLELSRLESGQVDLTLEDVDVLQVIDETIVSYGWDDVLVRASGPTLAHTDRRSVARLALNLIGNAVRHARHQVVVTVRGGPDDIMVEVRDDGPGLKAEHVDILNGRAQHEAQRRETHGLGLLIIRAHAELLGAGLDLVTEPDTGTAVRLTFRAADDPTDAGQPGPISEDRRAPGPRTTEGALWNNHDVPVSEG